MAYSAVKPPENDMKDNWFDTLAEALESEGLIEAWADSFHTYMDYGQTIDWTWDDGSKYGHYISIFRNERGRYERPVHYAR